jgi:malate permease and related proteins
MEANLQVAETVIAFSVVILICLLLRRFSIIKEGDEKVFSKLLTQLVLPAAIFLQLSSAPIKSSQIMMVVAIIIAGLLSILLAALAGRLLKLSKPKTGALMLTSSFGSSALLGYPLISYSFPGNPEALADAVLLSELGVGLPIFILGPAIAIYYGDHSSEIRLNKSVFTSYFFSPVFLSVLAGILISFFPFNRDHGFIAPFYEALRMMYGSLTVLACLIIALQLKLKSLKGLLPLFFISAAIQMLFQPFAAHAQAALYHLPSIQTQVLVLISTMPSAVLGPVFASRYNCAPATASALVMAHILLSIVMIPAVYYLMN